MNTNLINVDSKRLNNKDYKNININRKKNYCGIKCHKFVSHVNIIVA